MFELSILHTIVEEEKNNAQSYPRCHPGVPLEMGNSATHHLILDSCLCRHFVRLVKKFGLDLVQDNTVDSEPPVQFVQKNVLWFGPKTWHKSLFWGCFETKRISPRGIIQPSPNICLGCRAPVAPIGCRTCLGRAADKLHKLPVRRPDEFNAVKFPIQV